MGHMKRAALDGVELEYEVLGAQHSFRPCSLSFYLADERAREPVGDIIHRKHLALQHRRRVMVEVGSWRSHTSSNWKSGSRGRHP